MWSLVSGPSGFGHRWFQGTTIGLESDNSCFVRSFRPDMQTWPDPSPARLLTWRRFKYDLELGAVGTISRSVVCTVILDSLGQVKTVVTNDWLNVSPSGNLYGVGINPESGEAAGWIVVSPDGMVSHVSLSGIRPSYSLIGHRTPLTDQLIEAEGQLWCIGKAEASSLSDTVPFEEYSSGWPEFVVKTLWGGAQAQWLSTKGENLVRVGPKGAIVDFYYNRHSKRLRCAFIKCQEDLHLYLESGLVNEMVIDTLSYEAEVGKQLSILNFAEQKQIAESYPTISTQRSPSVVSREFPCDASAVASRQLFGNVSPAELRAPLLTQTRIASNSRFAIRALSSTTADPNSSTLIWLNPVPWEAPSKTSVPDEPNEVDGTQAEWKHAEDRSVFIVDIFQYGGLNANYSAGTLPDTLIDLGRELSSAGVRLSHATVGGFSFGASLALMFAIATQYPGDLILRHGSFNRLATPLGFQTYPVSLAESPEVYDEFTLVQRVDSVQCRRVLIETSEWDANESTAPWQSEALHQMLTACGLHSNLVTLNKTGHDLGFWKSQRTLYRYEKAWLDENLYERKAVNDIDSFS